MKNKKILIVIIGIILAMGLFSACRESDRVSYNLSQQADNFNVVRQLTVLNGITDDVMFQMTGKMSIEVIDNENQVEIVVEKKDGTYAKHFVGLSDNVTYIVEQVSGEYVNKYRYSLNYNPKMWIPVDFDVID